MTLTVNEHRGVWSREHQEILMPWLRAHGVDPAHVPHDSLFDFDLSTDPWTCSVERYRRDAEDRLTLVNGDVVRDRVLFKVKVPFPLSAEVTP
jgi:hypothetical protein